MPYSTNNELPDAVKKLSDHEQTVWREAFNSAMEQNGSEEEAARIAWAAVDHAHMMKQPFTIFGGLDLKDLVTRDLASETEVQIALPGHYVQGEKEFDLTVKDFAEAEKNFLAAENPLPVDYEHNTFVNGAEAPAAGWVKKIINRGERGLYAVIAWTKGAAERIREGEYRFISPVLFFNSKDTKTGETIGTSLGPPGLTNFPLIQGMEPLTARRVTDRILPTKKEKKPMKEFLAKLFAALGISAAEDIGEDKAVEIVQQRLEDAKKPFLAKRPAPIYAIPPKLLAVMGLPEDASEEDALAKAAFLTHPGDRVPPEQYEELNSKMLEREIQDLIAKASGPGTDDMSAKLYPSEKEWAIKFARENGLNVAREFIRLRPKVLAIMDRLPGKKEKPLVIDETQDSINQQLGVSKEAFLKYNGNATTH